jgi:ketosteroid isomerase-like protein
MAARHHIKQWRKMSLQLTPEEVTSAAERIVGAYSAMDEDAYFTSFDPQATFIFHGTSERLASREDYKRLWRIWVSEGWNVISCHSSDPFIQIYGTTAVFSHTVTTTTDEQEKRASTEERETIVFTRSGSGGVLAVHEHLSLNTF